MTAPASWIDAPAPPLGENRLPEERQADFWIRAFVLFEIACQLAVIGPLGSIRTLLRIASFGASLAFIFLVRGQKRAHPAQNTAAVVVVILLLSVVNPTAAALPAALAQVALYVAILGPLWWVPRLQVTGKTLRTLLYTLWGFYSIGALVGVLQVYFPGRFQPNVSPVVLALGHGYVESLKIVTSGGVEVFRPMGLTDVPGGASSSALYAVILGIGVFITAERRWLSATAIGTVLIGLVCLYLSQVRAMMVVAGISIVGVTAVLVIRRDYRRVASFGVVVVAMAIASFRGARSLAGGSVERRVQSLAQGTPEQVYMRNRGGFLVETFEDLLPEYPLGAGAGRWGMMQAYFGDRSNPNEALWAEIQWAGWVLDGGAPLLLAYCWMLGITLLVTLRLARRRFRSDPRLPLWAAVILGYSVGTCAFTFSYPVFLSQTGMEFWLLNLALFAAARTQAQYDAHLDLVGP